MSGPVLVLGARGMLGQTLLRVLEEAGVRTRTVEGRFDPFRPGSFLDAVGAVDADAIVNCVAVLPDHESSPTVTLAVNGLLPQLLAARLGAGRVLVQASTDGVFRGDRGDYAVFDQPDAIDDYGLAKRLGEAARELGPTVVIRSSIVGPERGLMAWLLAQHGSVSGYSTHRWNGVTTLTWARACLAILAARDRWLSRIEHLTCGSPVSKAQLLAEIARTWELDVTVVPTATVPVDRTLRPTIRTADIGAQLAELRRWSEART